MRCERVSVYVLVFDCAPFFAPSFSSSFMLYTSADLKISNIRLLFSSAETPRTPPDGFFTSAWGAFGGILFPRWGPVSRNKSLLNPASSQQSLKMMIAFIITLGEIM